MSESTKFFHSIKSLAEHLGVPQSTLRYWETVFPELSPSRTQTGRRLYSAADAAVASRIRELLHDKGMKIEAARRIIGESRKYPPRNRFSCNSREDALRLLSQAERMTGGEPHVHERISAVAEWINRSRD